MCGVAKQRKKNDLGCETDTNTSCTYRTIVLNSERYILHWFQNVELESTRRYSLNIHTSLVKRMTNMCSSRDSPSGNGTGCHGPLSLNGIAGCYHVLPVQ